MKNIDRPTLILDETKCRKNMLKMKQKAERNGLAFRPHFKTHVSIEIGEWFRELGVDKIAVSSIAMAEYFAEAGWKDILVAFPCNLRSIERINKLAAQIDLNILVEDPVVLAKINTALKYKVSVWINIDSGYGRCGIKAENDSVVLDLASQTAEAEKLKFKGMLSHAGHSYGARSKTEIGEIHDSSIAKIQNLSNKLRPHFPELEISIGDTPTCCSMEHFGPATEIRPGNFVFFDLSQNQIGSCAINEIAVCMACPIVAIYPERNEMIIHGGTVHFAQDLMLHANYEKEIHGLVVEQTAEFQWGETTGSYLKKLSQEHGTVHLSSEDAKRYQIGDLVFILPVHSCTCANLMGGYLLKNGNYLKRMSQ